MHLSPKGPENRLFYVSTKKLSRFSLVILIGSLKATVRQNLNSNLNFLTFYIFSIKIIINF